MSEILFPTYFILKNPFSWYSQLHKMQGPTACYAKLISDQTCSRRNMTFGAQIMGLGSMSSRSACMPGTLFMTI